MNILDNKDKLGSLLLLMFSLAYLVVSFDIPLDPTAAEVFTSRSLPIGLAVMTIICCLLQLSQSDIVGDQESLRTTVKDLHWKPMILLSVLMFIYALSFDLLGFMLASALFLLLGFMILGERRFTLAAGVAVGLPVFMWLILTQGFGVYLDHGSFYRMVMGAF